MINDKSTTLATRFRASKGQPVKYENKLVHAMYTRNCILTGAIRIRFKSATKAAPQALCVKARKGALEINKIATRDIAVLWTDTAPNVVDVIYRFKGKGEIRFWNAWKDSDGVQHAWIGNAGMLVSEQPGHTTLSCSDGIGDPEFRDLIVEISDK